MFLLLSVLLFLGSAPMGPMSVTERGPSGIHPDAGSGVGQQGPTVGLPNGASAIGGVTELTGSSEIRLLHGNGTTPGAPDPDPLVRNTTVLPTPIHHVIVIMDENEENSTTLAEPYQGNLSRNYGYAANFWSVHHNSETDYVGATGGVTYTHWNLTYASLANLLDTAGESWAEYEESMPRVCDVDPYTLEAGLYNPQHNPFVHFQYVSGSYSYCAQHELVFNSTSFEANLSAGILDNYTWITPNSCDDGHGTNATGMCPTGPATNTIADTWLSQFIPHVISSPLWNSTAVLILYDEGISGTYGDDRPYGSGGGHVYSVAVSPYARLGYESQIPYDTFSILTTTEWLLGLGRTGQNDSWAVHPPMYDLFQFNRTYSISGTVTNSAGSPIPGANITNAVFNWTLTNATGGFSLTAPNNTYRLSAEAPGYGMENQTIHVSGSNIHLDFILNQSAPPAQRNYPVTWVAPSLANTPPGGLTWYVNVTGGPWLSGSSTTIFASLPNGTYSFEVASNDKAYAPSYGPTFDVNGTAVNVTVGFALVTYPVTFTGTGLTPGSTWNVTLNGSSQTSTLGTISFLAANGTYSYSVGTVAGYGTEPSSAMLLVEGGPVDVQITFVPLYTLTFTESALPLGSNWSVALTANDPAIIQIAPFVNASLTRWADAPSKVQFDVSNGSYSYMASDAPGGVLLGGNVTITGPMASPVTVDFPAGAAPVSGTARTIDLPIPSYLIVAMAAAAVAVAAGTGLIPRKEKRPMRPSRSRSGPSGPD
ncbi:MAG: alkaline phosphatase family protein [Thermoplasmata archaeon]